MADIENIETVKKTGKEKPLNLYDIKLTWDDNTNLGYINDYFINEKPSFSFDYVFLYVNKKTAQYLKNYLEDSSNTMLTQEQLDEVKAFVDSYVPPVVEEPSLEQLKEEKLKILNQNCDKKIIAGFYSNALGSKHFYHSTLEEQSTLNSLINIGIDNMFKAQKVLPDGSLDKRIQFVHTLVELKKVLIDGATHIGTCVAEKDALEEKINNPKITKTELEAINV